VGRPTGWPARSPDFSPLDLYVWENTETTVYGAEVSDVQDIQQQSWFTHATSCLEAGHFEHIV